MFGLVRLFWSGGLAWEGRKSVWRPPNQKNQMVNGKDS